MRGRPGQGLAGSRLGLVLGLARATAASPGNPVAFAAGSAVEFKTAQPVSVEKVVAVQEPGD